MARIARTKMSIAIGEVDFGRDYRHVMGHKGFCQVSAIPASMVGAMRRNGEANEVFLIRPAMHRRRASSAYFFIEA